jgi:putative flippase GtrA
MMQPARWLRFNLVGVGGFVLQLSTLAAVEHWFAVPPGVSVSVAVLAAVSHNFFWHERVTWPGQQRTGRARRWLSFNLSNGLVSLLTNLVLTTAVTTATGAPLVVANVVAVVLASMVNFWISDRLVFHCVRYHSAPPAIERGAARQLSVRRAARMEL